MALANYVKFLRGTLTAYNNLAEKDQDTLYFVYNADKTQGKLYLGDIELSGSMNESGVVDYLSELNDVDTAGAVQNSLLGFNGTKWIPMDVNTLVDISVMDGASAETAGKKGLVPAPAAGEETYFLRGDGQWAPIHKHSVQIFEIELNEDETHEAAITRAVGEAVPVVGDFVIVKDVNERISYIYNGLAWIALNNKYLDYINRLQESINSIADVLTGDDGLQNQVDNLQSELADKANKQDVEDLNAIIENKADKTDVETLSEALNNKADKSDLDNKANVADVYTKGETNTAIAAAIASVDHLKRKIVNDYNDIQNYIDNNNDADRYIFMVPTIYNYTVESNKYDEYVVLKTEDSEGGITYTIEPVGSWAVDLDDYYKKTEADAKFVVQEDGKGLVDNADIEKLASIPAAAEENYIKNVNEEQFIVSNVGELSLTPVITNALLTESDKAKLNALILGDNNNIEISGKVNAFNVEELNVWIEQNRDDITGLVSTELQSKIENIIDPIIHSVNSNEFNITDEGQLNLGTIDVAKITNIDNFYLSNEKYAVEIGNIENLIHASGKMDSTIIDEINDLNRRLSWQDMSE